MEATSVSNSNAKEDETLSSYVSTQPSTNIVIADNDSDENSLLSLLNGGMKEHRARVSVCSFSLSLVSFSSSLYCYCYFYLFLTM